MAGRIGSALSAIIGTIVNVLTLPFRVVGRLLGGGRRRKGAA
ncbi:MAG: hypothetical protein JWO67_4953 [Streptosporangiaceae bacterium]|jgi:hypothetical protein|nr:hypothetical protein [Streptosporangiaceae bacterium]